MATLPGAWRYRVSTGTGRPDVSILWLGEAERLICNFYLSVAARQIVWADPSLRCTSLLLGRSATNKQTNKLICSFYTVWQHIQLYEQICPCDTQACCWDIQQPTTTNKCLPIVNHLYFFIHGTFLVQKKCKMLLETYQLTLLCYILKVIVNNYDKWLRPLKKWDHLMFTSFSGF